MNIPCSLHRRIEPTLGEAKMALLFVTMTSISLMAHSSIVYLKFSNNSTPQEHDGIYITQNPFEQTTIGAYLNLDGAEITLDVSAGFEIFCGPDGAGVLTVPSGLVGDERGFALPLTNGFLIGSNPPSSARWQAAVLDEESHTRGPLIHEWLGETNSRGLFTGLESAYVGLRLLMAGRTHYGWIRVGAPDAGINGGWIYDLAYERRAETAIRAGAKPNPIPLAEPRIARAGFLRLEWASDLGTAYQIQSKPDLGTFFWDDLNLIVTATSTNTLVDVPMGETQQFFRVVKVD